MCCAIFILLFDTEVQHNLINSYMKKLPFCLLPQEEGRVFPHLSVQYPNDTLQTTTVIAIKSWNAVYFKGQVS